MKKFYEEEIFDKKRMMLIKFVEKKYLRNFIEKGEIHFSPLESFIKADEICGDTIVGDRYEGKLIRKIPPENIKMAILDDNGKVKGKVFTFSDMGQVQDVIITEIYPEVKKSGISCFSYINLDEDLYEFKKTDDNIFYKIKTDIINGLKDISGDRIPVVMYSNPIFEAIENDKSCLKGLSFCMNIVSYYKETNNDIPIDKYYNNPFLPIFKKRNKYANQKELRMVLKTDVGDGMNIYAGHLRNTFSLNTFDDLYNLVLIKKCKS